MAEEHDDVASVKVVHKGSIRFVNALVWSKAISILALFFEGPARGEADSLLEWQRRTHQVFRGATDRVQTADQARIRFQQIHASPAGVTWP